MTFIPKGQVDPVPSKSTGMSAFPHRFVLTMFLDSVCSTVELNACVKERMLCSCWNITLLFIYAVSHPD